ncbi:MAG: hypothetical protein GY948_23995 [Alphaproteobacteria bacterium]|nr:hypothetical protein [Alphaproteobacteria bacterium]
MQSRGHTAEGQFGARHNGQVPVGASPINTWRYTSSAPHIGPDEQTAALECLMAGEPSNGRYVQAFEQAFAQLHGAKHAIAVANGTASIHLALLAAEIGQSPDDEVIQPSLNSVAAANMTIAVGARPVFADIVSLTEPTLDLDEACALIGPNTRAVVAMHYGGYPARIAALESLCRARGVLLIEQCCHGPGYVGPEFADRALGTMGNIGCFSLGPDALATCGGGGGMIVTDDDALAARMRSLLLKSSTTLHCSRNPGRTSTANIAAHGFNFHMDDLRAAIGLAQLKNVPSFNIRRQRRAQAYANVVETFCDGAIEYVFGWAPMEGTAHVAAILVEPSRRDGLRAFLTEKRVQTSLHYPPLHTFGAFADCRAGDLTQSGTFSDAVIVLPIHPDLPVMAPEHIIRLCEVYLAEREPAHSHAAEGCLRVA